ncbi:MAG: hypothetical protein ACUZ8E_09755 [Candidatus Anammoxibacter sp.]
MKAIKTVGIKNLKDQLSAYLREVKAGDTVLVTDRGNVIAEIHEPTIDTITQKNRSIQEEWVHKNKLIPPMAKKKKCPFSPVKLKTGIAKNLLRQERGE